MKLHALGIGFVLLLATPAAPSVPRPHDSTGVARAIVQLVGECSSEPGPGELQPFDCSQEQLLKSLNSNTSTFIEFVNGTDGPANIYWLNFDGQRVLYHRMLEPGESVVQQTYLTHPWVVTDAQDACLALFLPGPQLSRATICRYVPAAVVELAWDEPAGNAMDPPQNLTASIVGVGSGSPSKRAGETPRARALGDPQVCGYNVYRFDAPGGQPNPANLALANIVKTSVEMPLALRGNYFVVTACYPEGESGPSNETSAGTPGATIEHVVVRPKKIVTTGSGFTDSVRIFLDGTEFVSRAAVKKNHTKAVQKGSLTTGETINQYMTPGRMVEISYVNDDQSITRFMIEVPPGGLVALQEK